MNTIKRVCVFCGSNNGARPEYLAAAENLGRALLREKIGLVYGGANVGMMRRIADVVHDGGGEVIGVITAGLMEKEIGHRRLSDLRVVSSLHKRKALMSELADGFIALPGGLGTLDELFEVLTWAQLGIHHKPCGLLNVGDYYRLLLAFLKHAVAERLVRREHLEMLLVARSARALIGRMRLYRPVRVEKWIDLDRGKGRVLQ